MLENNRQYDWKRDLQAGKLNARISSLNLIQQAVENHYRILNGGVVTSEQ